MRFEWKVNGSFAQIDAMLEAFDEFVEELADDQLGTGFMDDEELRKITSASHARGWQGINSQIIVSPRTVIFIGRTTAFEASIRREPGGMPVLEDLLDQFSNILFPQDYTGEAEAIIRDKDDEASDVAEKALKLADRGQLRKLAQQVWAARMVTGKQVFDTEDIDRAQEAWNTYSNMAKHAIASLALPDWALWNDATKAIEVLEEMLQV